jgi:hypothetical protein
MRKVPLNGIKLVNRKPMFEESYIEGSETAVRELTEKFGIINFPSEYYKELYFDLNEDKDNTKRKLVDRNYRSDHEKKELQSHLKMTIGKLKDILTKCEKEIENGVLYDSEEQNIEEGF